MTHEGPQYVVSNTSTRADISSSTELKLYGDAASKGFSWLDGLEKLHFVKVSSVEPEMTVFFPVSDCVVQFKASNIDGASSMVRTSCGPHHKWCEATFSYKKAVMWQGEHVRATLQFYIEEKAKHANLAG
ncbi:Hypothetical predicted protein [Paramuricea clavata]|uniref:Uncharacterized protein n=1 Tax=Paramuricea clavata TaxID=317549 RepID=A0A6S7HXJ3_PARCT|nr:Hypothetical predicted protein [Paramuricea clavata]